jgi:uncharacterized protein (TIGR00288 family)
MPAPHASETKNMALFCDFENIALGVRDAHYDQFDISKVLERLLLKGNIVVKKAYCDWARYKALRPAMHEASFELIEIPHVRQSGKNSADIRMVVDALDLCYTKGHVDTFVIISGDSDFSPLVSKLRENNRTVIGVGVKESTSDLLIANCDEFIYYDDLVRPQPPRGKARSPGTAAKPSSRSRSAKTAKAAPSTPATPSTPAAPSAQGPKPATAPAEPAAPPPAAGDKKREAWNLIVETYEALVEERGEGEKIWGSMIKQTLKRRKPGFSESYYGFRSFGQLLEEAEAQGILQLERDEKSGGFLIKSCHAS